ncbi:MAG: GNAT family N-acetyltransferase [Deferribacteraceae bacterium]|nr:GNAT family N-acetyltransferase [Deferribacteraceae bacterium]
MVTPLLEQDWNDLLDLWERSIRATHTFLDPDDIPIFKEVLATDHLGRIDLFCIKDNGIIGVVGVDGKSLELLFVEPSLMGRGIGKMLLEYAMNSCNISKVEVNEDNKHAVEFYKRAGFAVKRRTLCKGLTKRYPMLHMER